MTNVLMSLNMSKLRHYMLQTEENRDPDLRKEQAKDPQKALAKVLGKVQEVRVLTKAVLLNALLGIVSLLGVVVHIVLAINTLLGKREMDTSAPNVFQ